MKIEETIEKAMVSILEARTYFSANSVPVVRFRDRLTTKGNRFCTVHANPFERLSPTHDFYEVQLDLLSDSKSQEDVKANQLDDIYEQCADELDQTLTTTTLQAAIDAVDVSSGITIDGLVPGAGDDTDGDYQIVRAGTLISLTYIKP